MSHITKRWSGNDSSVAAPCSQWIARSPVRNGHRGGPLNRIVSRHLKRILFVCTQNKLRSPTAEQVFSSWADLEVASAGLGNDAAVMSHQVAEELEHFRLGSEQILAHSHLPAPGLEHYMVTGVAKKGHSDWTRYPERSMGGSP